MTAPPNAVADIDVLADIPNRNTIRALLRQRSFIRNYESTAGKYDTELAKYPADDVARIAFEDAFSAASHQFKKHFSERYRGSGLASIPTPEPMHPDAVAALLTREAALVAERDALAADVDALRGVLSGRRFAMKAGPCGVSMEEVDSEATGFVYYMCSDFDAARAEAGT